MDYRSAATTREERVNKKSSEIPEMEFEESLRRK